MKTDQQIAEDLFERISSNLPEKYRWMINERARRSLSYDNSNPEGFGEFRPRVNWVVSWRDNTASVIAHGGHMKNVLATFKF